MGRGRRVLWAGALLLGVLVAGPAGARPSIGTTPCVDSSGAMDGKGVSWSPTTLWPPNHSLRTVRISWTGDKDAVSPGMIQVAVSQVQDSQGPTRTTTSDPNSAKPVADPGPATTSVRLPATRSGRDGTRVFKIAVTCTESGGIDVPPNPNDLSDTGHAILTVVVPHDMGHR